MDAQDWADWGSVFRAGADRARGWVMNIDRKQDAEILDAQADRCFEIARERAGNPPVSHGHYHWHFRGDDKIMHRHAHDHAAGETGHDGHPHAEPYEPFAHLDGTRRRLAP